MWNSTWVLKDRKKGSAIAGTFDGSATSTMKMPARCPLYSVKYTASGLISSRTRLMMSPQGGCSCLRAGSLRGGQAPALGAGGPGFESRRPGQQPRRNKRKNPIFPRNGPGSQRQLPPEARSITSPLLPRIFPCVPKCVGTKAGTSNREPAFWVAKETGPLLTVWLTTASLLPEIPWRRARWPADKVSNALVLRWASLSDQVRRSPAGETVRHASSGRTVPESFVQRS